MPIIIPANSATSGGFDIANSLRFNRDSSDSLSFTPDSTTNRRTFTISFWMKIMKYDIGGSEGGVFNGGTVPNSNGWFNIQQGHTSDGDFMSQFFSGAFRNFKLTQRVMDPSAWYHFVVAMDTTQGTDTNRLKYYINGTQVTAFSSPIYPDQNFDTKVSTNEQIQSIGSKRNGSAALTDFFDGYLSEFIMIDGQQLAPDQFGEFDEDTGIWKPIDVSGLTFGDNGYYLEFKQSGTSQNSSGLGADTSGNDNHFAVTNLTAVDQSIDTCTNNFCTINNLDNFYAAATLAEGNLKVTCNAGNTSFITSTFGLTKGKWYWEAKLTTVGGEEAIGITDIVSTATDNYAGQTANSYSFKGNNGNIRNADENASYGSAYGASVIGVYMDLDNNKLYFAINGTIQASGAGFDITAAASTTNGFYFPMVGDVDSDSPVWEVNFGNPVSALDNAGVADANGYGSFEYDPSAGTFDSASKDFLAICTKNLAESG